VTFPDEVLMAYADGELDASTRAAVEAAMASDPEVARRVSQHKALRNRVSSAFNELLDEPVPARLLTAAHNEHPSGRSGTRKGNVLPLGGRQAQRWTWPQWTAIAASLIIGVIVGRLALMRTGSPPPLAMRGGRMLAAGMLADALSEQLAGDQTAAAQVRIGVSFRSKTGEYCRTFSLRQPAALAGLACRATDGWELGVLARTESPDGGSVAYRQAASPMPPAVIAAVESQIAGGPLDAHAEAAARGRHWHP
jgi:anti-sigma factor RsiW